VEFRQKKDLTCQQEMLLKPRTGHILPFSLAPPLNKVSQVEIEAGDCEGRLPLLFLLDVSCQLSVVSCNVL